ncbi:hypothetical protein [Halolamina sp. C58]|uniref:hypothetical protein n=1 Tax=Halolamina sp. C58 TaxID=3421640 RepID=UPI003EB797A3
MSDGGDVPDHLSEGPTFDDPEYLFGERTVGEIGDTHEVIADVVDRLPGGYRDDSVRYFVLGNYDDPQKERLRTAKSLLADPPHVSIALLLDDLDVATDDWNNFYLKFRVVLDLTDFAVVVAEDNDGGHELELGELPLDSTYVAKRDYADAAIDEDLEREKYDAMMAKLFELLDANDQLVEWRSRREFEHAIGRIGVWTLPN